MTDKQLDIIEAAAKAATPGPWRHPGRALVVSRMSEDEPLVCNCLSQEFAQAPKDAAFISAANPSIILDLIAELRQARRERDWLASQLEGACYSAEDAEYCSLHDCNDCKYTSAKVWLEAAKEAVK